MPIELSLAALALLVMLAAGLGLTHRRLANRARRASQPEVAVVPSTQLGDSATLVLLSTEFCAQCPGVRRMLRSIADERPGVRHVDVDLTTNTELARSLRVLQTPTTLILDASGHLVTRFSGATSRTAIDSALDAITARTPIGATHV